MRLSGRKPLRPPREAARYPGGLAPDGSRSGLLVLLEALVIAGLVLERIRRARVEGLLAERFRFESLLSELSARLIPVSLGDVDTEIERGLQRVVEFLRMDRASLIEYVPAGTVVRIAWAVEGVERVSPILEAGQFPWAADRVQRGEVVRFSSDRRAAPGGGGDRSEELPGLGHPVVSDASAECPRVHARCAGL